MSGAAHQEGLNVSSPIGPPPDPIDALGLDLDGVESSYRAAHLGFLLYGLVRSHAPRVVVELGTYRGYSALHFAAALRDNADSSNRLHLIDLWSGYPYRHCSMETTRSTFRRNHLLNLSNCAISFEEGDAFESCAGFEDETIDFLHIDVSNTGDNLKQLLERWAPKMTRMPNSLIVIEGGSAERDQIPWMVERKMKPIQNFLTSEWLKQRFSHFCFHPFPSLTVLKFRNDSTS